MTKDDIAGLGLKELIKKMMAMGEPPLRAKQVYRWVHKKAVADFGQMTDITAALKDKLAGSFTVGALKLAEKLVSKDGTEKYLWELRDQKLIETVLIKDKERNTVCLSTQVGCKFRCPFCASGKDGFKRNLTAGEIVAQLLGVKRETGEVINNVVFMGMGEPLDNFENLKKAIILINDPEGSGIGARKITVSTTGIVPGIKRMKELGLQAELSISLHATNNEERNMLVPANIAYPIEDLVDACKAYFHDTKRIVTLEYIMIAGENDSLADATRLIKLAREMHARVNLIAFNTSGVGRFKPSGAGAIEAFCNRLMLAKINVSVRRSRGGSIFAACGQLAGARAKKAS